MEPYQNPALPMEERIADALARMTDEEKVAMCHAQGKFSSPGCPRLGIPELWWSDGPHGIRAEICWNSWDYAGWRNDACTVFPVLTALAATWNRGLAAEYGDALAREARFRRKDVVLGPGLNIYRTPLNGRNFEYLGEDPYLAGELAVPYIRAIQRLGVAACIKHFALNNQEKWRGNVEVEVDERALHEIYLPAFRKAVTEGGAWAVMGAYNRIWGEYCCHNRRLLCSILRDEWGFDGVVVTDWGGCHDTRSAALNGLDVEMGSFTNGLSTENATYDDYYLARPYLEMLRRGELPAETLDRKAANILRLIFRTAMRSDRPVGELCSEHNYDVARRIASEAIVLLKNDGALLPLDPATAGNVLVVGENAVRRLNEGGGSSELKARDMFTPLDAIHEAFGAGNVAYEPGYESGRAMLAAEDKIPAARQAELRRRAVEAARRADTVIYIGGLNKNAWQDCESTDRRSYNLPYGQDSLIEDLCLACPRTVVANMSGNAYAMPWADSAPAILQAWYLGTMAGPALADVLTGKVNPSGRLPFSWPRSLADCPAHAMGTWSYPGVERGDDSATPADLEGADVGTGRDPLVRYLEGIGVGYRGYDMHGTAPLFPFGHGLSYTSFGYGAPQLSAHTLGPEGSIVVSMEVTNTGSRAGSVTVPLFVAPPQGALPRPPRELKGFAKAHLAPGASQRLTFNLTPEHLTCYDPALRHMTVPEGTYRVILPGGEAAFTFVLNI